MVIVLETRKTVWSDPRHSLNIVSGVDIFSAAVMNKNN